MLLSTQGTGREEFEEKLAGLLPQLSLTDMSEEELAKLSQLSTSPKEEEQEEEEENKMDVSSSGKLDEALSEVVIDISDMNRGRVTVPVCSKECWVDTGMY